MEKLTMTLVAAASMMALVVGGVYLQKNVSSVNVPWLHLVSVQTQ